MPPIITKLKAAASYIQTRYSGVPVVGIILGSGLGNFVKEMEVEKEIRYEDIPHFPVSTVDGHSGVMIFGKLGGKQVVAMAGRFHYYEGYSVEDVVFPVRVMKFLGVQTLLISNAAGTVNPAHRVGDLMAIKDHISFFTPNPLVGRNEEELGPRFPDMSQPYSLELIRQAREIAIEENITLHEGVYTGVTGPTFETRAEYRLIKLVGGDVVGMSTVQEVIAAVHMGMTVFAVSVVTDIAVLEEGGSIITHEEVLHAAAEAEPRLTTLFKRIIERISLEKTENRITLPVS
ncbi:MAG TPA: purine-nucleoside phosphorylase [Parasegetibacter sp.]|jgi:purine-nucleoside phosphorylase